MPVDPAALEANSTANSPTSSPRSPPATMARLPRTAPASSTATPPEPAAADPPRRRGHVASYRTWQRIPAARRRHLPGPQGRARADRSSPRSPSPDRDIDEATGDEITSPAASRGSTVKVFHQGQLVAPPDLADRAAADAAHRRQPLAARLGAVTAQLGDDGYTVELSHRSPVRPGTAAPTSRPATSRSRTTSNRHNASRPCSTNGPTSRSTHDAHRAPRDLTRSRSRVRRLPALPHHRPRQLQLLRPLPRRLGRRRPELASKTHRRTHPARHRHDDRHPRIATVDRPHPRPVLGRTGPTDTPPHQRPNATSAPLDAAAGRPTT